MAEFGVSLTPPPPYRSSYLPPSSLKYRPGGGFHVKLQVPLAHDLGVDKRLNFPCHNLHSLVAEPALGVGRRAVKKKFRLLWVVAPNNEMCIYIYRVTQNTRIKHFLIYP